MKFSKLKDQIFENKIVTALMVLNFISAIVAFIMANSTTFADEKAYLLMADGIREGRFSSWFFLDAYYPETLRTPGYPLFLLLLKTLGCSVFGIKLIQLGIYYVTLSLSVSILKKLAPQNKKTLILYLLFTAINIQIPYYSGYISAEILCIFLTITYMYVFIMKEHSVKNGLLLGLVAGLLFMMRPAFLLFPFLITILGFIFNKPLRKYFALHVLVFITCLIPFGVWTHANHGVFKVTPLEGGAGVAHIGFWSFKLPSGYVEPFYWGNVVVPDYTNPIHFSDSEKQHFKKEFEEEWKLVLKELNPLLTPADTVNLRLMNSDLNPGLFPLYSSKFTIAREKALCKLVIKHIKQEPWFYIKTRLYSFARFYFTGINTDNLHKETSLKGKIKVTFLFFITFIFIFLGLIVVSFHLLRKIKQIETTIAILWLATLYQGVVHVPFAIQARYGVPIHLLILLLLSLALSGSLKTNKKSLN